MEFEELCNYVQSKLLASGVIPEWAANPWDANSVAARIIHNALRQTMSGDKWAWLYVNTMIADVIRFPPDPIDKHHFSLRAFLEVKNISIVRKRRYSHMNPLEWRYLVGICDKYGIDHYEIDSGVSYHENKEHLMGIVRMIDGCLDTFELGRMAEQQEKYMAENPLEYYASYRLADKVFGESARAELGEPDTSPQTFSLKTKTPIEFSLKTYIQQQI